MTLNIRQYQPGDLEDCRSLWAELTYRHREIYSDPSIGGENPGLSFDSFLDITGVEHFWVAMFDGKVVGLIGLIFDERETDGRSVIIEPIVVASSHRDRGIGRALLGHAAAEARRLGAHYLSIKPVARNHEAIALFYACGFQTLGDIEMVMELAPGKPEAWKEGPELFGLKFWY
jgi:GNAT superfamily N-acetyltransferase